MPTYLYATDKTGSERALVIEYIAKLYDLCDAGQYNPKELQAQLAEEIREHHARNNVPLISVVGGGADIIRPSDNTGLPEGFVREIEVHARMIGYIRDGEPEKVLATPGLQSFHSKKLDTTVTLTLPTEESEREREQRKLEAKERDGKRLAAHSAAKTERARNANANPFGKQQGGRHSAAPSSVPAGKQMEWEGDPHDYFS